MDPRLFAHSTEIVDIQKKIDWILFISKELQTPGFLREVSVLEKEKKKVMQKIIMEEISKKYPDLGFARAVRHDRHKRKLAKEGEKKKAKKQHLKDNNALRTQLLLNLMKEKAQKLETSAHEERQRMERNAGLERLEINIIANELKANANERKRPASDEANRHAKKKRFDN